MLLLGTISSIHIWHSSEFLEQNRYQHMNADNLKANKKLNCLQKIANWYQDCISANEHGLLHVVPFPIDSVNESCHTVDYAYL